MGRSVIIKNTSIICEGKLYNIQTARDFIQGLGISDNSEKDGDYDSDSNASVKSNVSKTSRQRERSSGSRHDSTKKPKPSLKNQTMGSLKNFIKRDLPNNNAV